VTDKSDCDVVLPALWDLLLLLPSSYESLWCVVASTIKMKRKYENIEAVANLNISRNNAGRRQHISNYVNS
jgi:hypothetical protein